MEENTYKVYAQSDASGRITAINSSAFLTDTTGWTQIDEGAGDKYHHAQGNYFDKPIMTESGTYRYKLVDGKAVERTSEEIAADSAPDLETVRTAKLDELNAAAQAAVIAGCDVTLSDGTTGHISLTPEDQINLSTAQAVVQGGASGYPYHLDGQLCKVYLAADILIMGKAAVAHILYHTTYCNHLRAWAQRVTTSDELPAITYGATLPDDLKANMEAIISAATA